MDRDDQFSVWIVIVGVAAGGAIAYLLASPRGKTLLRNLPHMLTDLTRRSEQVMAMVRDLSTEIEQSLRKVEASLQEVDQAIQKKLPAEEGLMT